MRPRFALSAPLRASLTRGSWVVPLLTLAVLLWGGQGVEAGEAQRWEYRVEKIDLLVKRPVVGPAEFLSATQLETRLSVLGATGWSLQSVVPLPDNSVLAVFQRPGVAPVPGPAASGNSGPVSIPHPFEGRNTVGGAELLQALSGGQIPIQLVDLRPSSAFTDGHVYGALSLPSAEVDKRHRELRRDAVLVLIDSGDGRGIGSANFLKNLGFSPVILLEGGMPSWPGAVVTGAQ